MWFWEFTAISMTLSLYSCVNKLFLLDSLRAMPLRFWEIKGINQY